MSINKTKNNLFYPVILGGTLLAGAGYIYKQFYKNKKEK